MRASRLLALALALWAGRSDAVGAPEAPLPAPAREVAAAAGLAEDVTTARDLPLAIARRLHVPWGERGRGIAAQQRLAALCTSQPARDEPIPTLLPAEAWAVLLERPVSRDTLACTLLTETRAALMYHGLAGLDAAARAALLRERPAMRWVARSAAPAFAAFAPALVVRESRLEVPGGAEARALWERLLEVRGDRPGEFARALLGRAGGRAAFLYATLSILEPAARAWALGLTESDPERRWARFQALVGAFEGGEAFWDPARAPLSRRTVDTARVLLAVKVTAEGRLAAPSARGFWEAAFAASGGLRPDTTEADAAFLVREIVHDSDDEGAVRKLRQLRFAQRLLAAGGPADASALLATWSAGERPALALALELLDASPGQHAAAWRRSNELAALAREAAAPAIVQFQAALALIVAARRGGLLAAAPALELAEAVIAASVGEVGYGGRLAALLESRLLPSFATATYGPVEPGDADSVVARLLAGVRPDRAAGRTFAFEGLVYRPAVDAARLQGLEQFATSQRATSLSAGLALARAARGLVEAETPAAHEALRAAVRPLPRFVPPGGEEAVDPQQRAADVLSAVRGSADARAANAARLVAAGDAAVADALAGLLYAAHAGALLERAPDALARRHVLGLGLPGAVDRARFAFAFPRAVAGVGRPWRVEGSLLGLEIGFARFALRRTSSDPPAEAPALGDAERGSLGLWAGQLAMSSPASLPDPAGVREAHERGRALLRALAPAESAPGGGGTREPEQPARQRLEALRLDPWRAERLHAALDAGEDLSTLFGPGELVGLGGFTWPAGFGVPRLLSEHRLALAPPAGGGPWDLFGRDRSGLLAERSIDLPVRLLLSLEARGLPAQLLPPLFAYAAQDAFDLVRLLYAEDETAYARFARLLPEARIDDYLAALAGDGALAAQAEAP